MTAVDSIVRVPARFLVGIDSGAHTSVFNNSDLLDNVKRVKCDPLRDWHGMKVRNHARGVFHPFGVVEVNPRAPINLLSEYDIKSRFKFTEVALECFIVHAPGRDVQFRMDHSRKMSPTGGSTQVCSVRVLPQRGVRAMCRRGLLQRQRQPAVQ